jgi:multicomponent Na+:H+ antiporter subunit D
LIGVPPAAGFISKWYMISGAASNGQIWAIAVLVVSTLLNAAYFLPIVYAAFFRPPQAGPGHGEAPLPILIALVITALLTLALFFFADLPLHLAGQLVEVPQRGVVR